MPALTTDLLEIAYADDGPRDGPPVLLLHGWPDSPRTWRDVAELLNDGLGLDRVAVVGHDWGARAGYAPAALVPDRLTALVAISVGYEPGGAVALPGFEQARLWWYQWFRTLDAGADAVPREAPGTVAELVAEHLTSQ